MFKPTWKFRPPPENTGSLELCKSPQNCLFGNGCTRAHSIEELREWKIRTSYHLQQHQKKIMTGRMQSAQSQIEKIRILINENRRRGLPPTNVMTEVSGGQSILCKQNLFVTHLDKNKEISWEFVVKINFKHHYDPAQKQGLQNVFILENDCHEFSLGDHLSIGYLHQDDPTMFVINDAGNEISLRNYSSASVMSAKIFVKFSSPSYGHFNATVVFDFGCPPRIVRHLGVIVAPEKHLFEKLSSAPTTSDEKHNELTWTQKYKLVSFDKTTKEEDVKSSDYSLPRNLHYGVEYGAFEYMDVHLTPENYRDRLHNLLYVEEYERRKRMSRLNVHCHDIFTLFRKRSNLPSLRTVDAKKALFVPVREETLEEVGILVSRGSKALIRLRQFVYGAMPDSEDFVVHEALVVNILSGEIVLEISTKTLTLLKSMTSPVPVDICFRFVNTFLRMHSAIDRVNLDLIFYKQNFMDTTPLLTPLRQSTLSQTQATALSRIIHSSPGPPVLLLGPFGTGKTQTLAEAVKVLISQQRVMRRCRILICTHSNSAADHYIEDYLHPFFKQMDENKPLCEKPLRLYWEHRLATSISDAMLPYCIMDMNTGTFRNPSLEELARKTIIVTTLVTADMLVHCGVKPGFFTHIFIDEAAQAMELETLIPISLATEKTKVVLAGDHLQLSPPVFSAIGRKLLLDKSLLVRLYESYPANSPRKILLLENFRSYREIVDIPSKLFYEGSLVSKKQSPDGLHYPVQFFGVHGLEEKAKDSPSYVNMAEVAEIAERVAEMVNTWPKEHFGELKLQKTCVLSAHYAQIKQIRRELRVNGFPQVRVENVNNVQGLEFDVLFLSIVRTSRMLGPGQHEGKDLGFLSNPKLLNTAITRAKFCLVVIGDPKALCSVGDCRVCWKTILSLCNDNGTFYYRLPLAEVLHSIRDEQTPVVPQGIVNTNALMQPHLHSYPRPFFRPQPYLQPYPQPFLPPPPYQQPYPQPFVPPQPTGGKSHPPPVSSLFHPSSLSVATPFMQPYFISPPDFSFQVPLAAQSHVVGKDITDRGKKDGSYATLVQPKPQSMIPTRLHNGTVQKDISQRGRNVQSQTSAKSQTTTPQSVDLPTSADSKSKIRDPTALYNYMVETDPTSYGKKDVELQPILSGSVSEEPRDLCLPGNRSISPTKPANELPLLSLSKTLRRNIADSLRNIIESEEAVYIVLDNPPEDISVEIRENLEAQLSLVEKQKISFEQQQVLNGKLAKCIHSLPEKSNPVDLNAAKIKDHIGVSDYSMRLSRMSLFEKVNLDKDSEVQEWYRLRKQDPIVQDYIKSFEMLSERARTRDNSTEQTTECCEITGGDNLNLRGWVLQPESVFIPSGNSWYEEYLSKDVIGEKLEIGEIVACTFSVDKFSSGKSAMCVLDDPMEQNILIPDRKSMNRAFNTDYVAVEITQDSEGQDLRKGKVVAILQERHHRQVVCRLASPESTIMIPINNINPKFAILQSDNHVGQTGVAVFDTNGEEIRFQHFVSDVQDRLFLVQFLKWDVSYRYPLGFVAKCFDEYSDPESLLPILCADYGIPNEFPVTVIEEVENRFPENWRVPDEELQSRCQYEDAFTIDSVNAEELDDAISVRPVRHGNYCVTVHVADVSYFVSKGSLVDLAAQGRATSVYLPPPSDLTVPLLPRRLSQVCSLLPGKERLAVSVEFVIDSSGRILRTPIFRRSVVVSQRKFTFGEVDGFLAGESMPQSLAASPLLYSLKVLYYLSRELWARRIRSGSLQACAEASFQSPSRRIVEELMIITNMAVAKKFSNFPDSHVVPFRIQSSPKYNVLQGLASWATENALNLKEMWVTQLLTGFQERESSHPPSLCIDLTVWQGICQAIMCGNMADLTEGVLSVHKNSSVTTLIPRLQQSLPKSRYISSTNYSSTELRHFALNADCYTHFTSPIRRYLDIVVHRVLFSEACTTPLYDDHEMEVLCNKLNLSCRNATAFSKHCAVICEAQSLREADGWKTMQVESVEADSMTLKNEEATKTSSLQKVKIVDLGASKCQDQTMEFVVSWTFYDVNLGEESSEKSLLENVLQGSRRVPKRFSSTRAVPDKLSSHTSAAIYSMEKPLEPLFQRRSLRMPQEVIESKESKTVIEISAEVWSELLEVSKKEDITAMVKSMNVVNKRATIALKNEASSEKNHSLTTNSSGFNVVKQSFRYGDKLQALFTCSSLSVLPQIFLQAIQVFPERICCIQHHRQPVECFCEKAKSSARERYSTVEEYQRVNIPLLKIESAQHSVRANVPTTHIRNVAMKWVEDSSNVYHGRFHIPANKMSASVNIRKDDFVCVRSTTTHVIHHGCVVDAVRLQGNDCRIQLQVLNTAATAPPGTVDVEVIPQCLKYKRMITAVRNLPQATPEVCSLFLSRDLRSLKQTKSRKSLPSFTLDASQRKAVDKAIHCSCSVIEGLPGTGKTYTAAAVAEHFYLENSHQTSISNVLFCCPTEQALNDAESILCRVPSLRLLRVHDREIEAESFPEIATVYGVRPRSTTFVPDTISQESALHFKIRSSSNPFHKKIQKYAQQLNMLTESNKGEQLCRVVEEYRKLLDMAEEFEFTESGVNIILCSCIEAGSARMQGHARVKQCIMDDSHCCLEAESLVVFQTLGTRCERVVLLGDSRVDAVPAVENKIARRFGLARSLFQSLRNGSGRKRLPRLVLDTQHRILGW